VPRQPPQIIVDADGLAELIAHLRGVGSFAYDSEFIGELTYVPKLCLIQVASHERIALIDPLAGLDLMPFWELLIDPSVEKVVHAGQQDVEPVIRLTGREPHNLFDTQLAGGFVRMAYPISLSRLVAEVMDVVLGKGLTFTHWDQRPLTAVQLRYAADDVRYLPAIRAELGSRLKAAGHLQWAREEFDSMCDASHYGFNPDVQYLRVRGSHSLKGQGLAVLRELTIWRDEAARAYDLPPRTFLRDEVLMDLAKSPVKSIDQLRRIRHLPKPVEQEYGERIVQATLAGLSSPADHLSKPRQNEQTPTMRFQADAVWAAAQSLCVAEGIDPALVMSHQEVVDWHRSFARGEDVSGFRLMRGWRAKAVGEKLVNLLNGKARVEMQWEDGLRAQIIGPAEE
jgi:ribonuclease D